MAANEPGPGETHLEVNVCWALLRSQEVGRLAVSIADRPEIFPINFVVDHGTVVFRTAEGTKLAGAVQGDAVAFEADGYERDTGEAWSVVVKGHAEEIGLGLHHRRRDRRPRAVPESDQASRATPVCVRGSHPAGLDRTVRRAQADPAG